MISEEDQKKLLSEMKGYKDKPVFFWMFFYTTSSILRKKATELKLIHRVPGIEVVLSSKLNELSEQNVTDLRNACGNPGPRGELAGYSEWKKGLLAYQQSYRPKSRNVVERNLAEAQ